MPPAIPRATYRVQLSARFGFDAAAEIVPYLSSLGISHLYASPFLKARPGSEHGYDIVDHNALNPELGGEEGFARLSEVLRRADMGLILDFVPNHMGVGRADNAWWLDVLEWGQKSPYAAMFDIDWSTLPHRSRGGLLLPILGASYGEALEKGEIDLRFDAADGSFSFWYFEHRLPVRPDRYAEIVKTAVASGDAAGSGAGQALLDAVRRYASLNAPSRAEAPKLKASLAAIDGAAGVLDAGLAAYRPSPERSSSVATLHRLLERQHYRLAHWRVAISEINYRRFFDINDLAGIRVEDARTFGLVHRKIAEMIRSGALHGLRIDHIDGLYNPAQYCVRLKRLADAARTGSTPLYTVVEKILAPGEETPRFAGVAGTTGYDVLNLISRVLIDGEGLPALENIWQAQAAPSRNFRQIAEDAKAQVVETTLASEFTVLARLLSRIAAGHWPSRDFTLDRLRAALQLYVVNFPVYRTYIAGTAVSAADRATIAQAIDAARDQWYGPDVAIFDFLRDALTLDLILPGRLGYSASRVKRFVAKVQQFTGPVAAKAIEDTAFYRYHRLLALNEVGNDPSLPALPVADFHAAMEARARTMPHAMTTTATHDTKRGEDARARLLALTEVAHDWSAAVRRWSVLNAHLIGQAKRRVPSRAHEYMLYQAMIGAWPDNVTAEFVARMQAYAVKAAREGKQDTSWTNPNEDYEVGLTQFVANMLDQNVSTAFVDEFTAFARRTSLLGALNSLSQLVLKATLPGVPDFYQGTELWDLSLVDPDNRRPVDFPLRASLLAEVDGRVSELAGEWHNGNVKLGLTRRLLDLRAAWPDVFGQGRYVPVSVEGRDRDHVVAFARVAGDSAIVVAVGRCFAAFTNGGRSWPRRGAFEATLALDGLRVESDEINRRALSLPQTAPLSAVFSDLPLAVLRATTH